MTKCIITEGTVDSPKVLLADVVIAHVKGEEAPKTPRSRATISPRVARAVTASIVVGNVDLVYGMQWRVELTLRPGRAVLEQRTTLYNRGDLPHRFYWWTNAAVEVWDDSHLLYPMDFTAAHGFAQLDSWPVDARGVDLSRPGNHTFGPVSLFAHASHEGFMGVYHPRTRAGVAHYADPAELPAKKVWSWGSDADGLDWRKALSDDGSAEAEIQAGLFRDQETYAFLAPQEVISFREHWLPVREIGGFVRVTPEAVLNLERAEGAPQAGLVVGLNVSETLLASLISVPLAIVAAVISAQRTGSGAHCGERCPTQGSFTSGVSACVTRSASVRPARLVVATPSPT